MAVADLPIIQEQMPELFDPHNLPIDWDRWETHPVPDPDVLAVNIDETFSDDSVFDNCFPDLPDWEGPIPGRNRRLDWGDYPPPDLLAFYLPIHFYLHSDMWGIYIILEGADWLAGKIYHQCSPHLTPHEARDISKIFLYFHELYHHHHEYFAIRLEITHRSPLYLKSFWPYYDSNFGTDKCIEEALANAFAYQKTSERVSAMGAAKLSAVQSYLQMFIKGCPPGYRLGMNYVSDLDWNRAEFNEFNHSLALPHIPSKKPSLWWNSPHAFNGTMRRNTHTKYIVKKGSPLTSRWRLW